jgi:hypothetical protein
MRFGLAFVHTLGAAIRDEGGTALAIGGVADHVHLLARLRQDKAISAVVVPSKRIPRVGCIVNSVTWRRSNGSKATPRSP